MKWLDTSLLSWLLVNRLLRSGKSFLMMMTNLWGFSCLKLIANMLTVHQQVSSIFNSQRLKSELATTKPRVTNPSKKLKHRRLRSQRMLTFRLKERSKSKKKQQSLKITLPLTPETGKNPRNRHQSFWEWCSLTNQPKKISRSGTDSLVMLLGLMCLYPSRWERPIWCRRDRKSLILLLRLIQPRISSRTQAPLRLSLILPSETPMVVHRMVDKQEEFTMEAKRASV